jgi:3-oxoacyl-[acyl-carrier protein] reductase
MTLNGKIAFITGGSRGIGAAIVRRLAAEGAGVAFTYANAVDQAEALAAGIRADGGRALALKADSASAEGVRAAVASALEELGGLNILVANAGILIRGLVNEVTLEQLDRMLAVNVRGVFLAIQAAAPHLGDGGRIITIGSNTAVRSAFPGASVYSMTKGAIASLVRGVAIDLAPRGITVNNVQPGPTSTDMNAGGDLEAMIKPLIPLRRMADPAEIAGMVAYLASPEAGFVTGASLTIDGGYVA